jgi:hypothetical protein
MIGDWIMRLRQRFGKQPDPQVIERVNETAQAMTPPVVIHDPAVARTIDVAGRDLDALRRRLAIVDTYVRAESRQK